MKRTTMKQAGKTFKLVFFNSRKRKRSHIAGTYSSNCPGAITHLKISIVYEVSVCPLSRRQALHGYII